MQQEEEVETNSTPIKPSLLGMRTRRTINDKNDAY